MSRLYDQVVDLEKRVFMPSVRRWPLAIERGDGSRVWDVDGNEFTDLTSGWGVCAIGHCHPAIVEALADQAQTLIQTTNVVYTRPQLDLAERIAAITPEGFSRSFFTASGSEANEGALKLAARKTGRSHFAAAQNSFHGRTLGVMGCLGQEKYRAPWRGIVREARFFGYGDLDAARAAIRDDTAAVIVEPIQGEGGVVLPPPGFLEGLRQICDATGALLIFDEVQTGIGRTGKWLAREHSGVRPDITTLGKGLGGGVPIAAFTATEEIMDAIVPGDHGGTYSGNPLMCRVGCAVLDVIREENLVTRAARLGERIMARLDSLAKTNTDKIESVRGRGLLIGMVLHTPDMAARLHAQARERGVLFNLTAGRVFRFFPALNIPEDEMDSALDLLESVIQDS